MAAIICPSRQMLLQYSLGFLSGEQLETVDRHLEGCLDCQTTITTLDDTNDKVIGLLRMPLDSESVYAEPQLQNALAAAMTIPARRQTAVDGSRSARHLMSDMPEMLGEYRLLEEVGRGGMGRVYKALHTKLDRVVALKLLSQSCGGDKKALARFEHEMKAVGRVAHPNVVQAHDAREIDGTPVLIMEYVDGLDLAEIIRRVGPVSVPEACELIRQTAVALQCIHEHGLVDRDVKPSNIMLARSGEVKLLDLGLARLRAKDRNGDLQEPDGEEITITGLTMGTADYMAPEQASDSGTVDIRADLYSLGCTLYKLLSGRPPFGGPGCRTTLDKLNAQKYQPAPLIRQLVPGVPEKVAAILDRLLAKNAGDRFSTPAELADALAPCCAGADLPELLRRAEGAERTPKIAEDSGSLSPATTETIAKPPMVLVSWGWRWFAGQLLILMILGGLGFALGIVVRIHKDGKQTAVEVLAGSRALVAADRQPVVTLPGQTKDPLAAERKPPAFSPSADAWALLGSWRIAYVEKGKRADLVWNAIFPDGRQNDSFAAFDRVTFDEQGGVTFSNLKTGWNGQLATRIDPTSTPKTMNLARRGRAGAEPRNPLVLGIYELDGDLLRICWTKSFPWVKTGQTPVDFAVAADSADLSLVLRRPVQERSVQGGWSAVSQVADGRGVPKPNLGLFIRDPASEPSVLLELNVGEKERSRVRIRGRCVLDTQMDPKWITIYTTRSAKDVDKQQDLIGIYEFDGKQLRLAYRMNGPRPEQFESKPGSGVTLLVLDRPKPRTTVASPGPIKSGQKTEATVAIERLGGRVTVDPKVPDKPVVSVVLAEWFVSDAELEYLQGFPQLRLLDLSNSEVTDAGLEHLRGLSQLQALYLANTRVTGAGLKKLQGLIGLQRLYLGGTAVTGASLEYLRGLARLEWLDLRDTAVDDVGLEHLKGLTQLESLYLGNTAVTDAGMAHLQRLTKLRALFLWRTAVTDAGLEDLRGATKLQVLNVWRTAVSDAGVEHLKDLANLRLLNVSNTRITDAGLKHLKNLTRLQGLNLASTAVTDAGLEYLKGMTDLHELYLASTAVTDAGLEHLEGLTRLQTLSLEHTKVTDGGRKMLQQALPGCRISD